MDSEPFDEAVVARLPRIEPLPRRACVGTAHTRRFKEVFFFDDSPDRQKQGSIAHLEGA